MYDKDQLRKADFITGILVSLFGFWIVRQAMGMPMKDSWGGVMNVWYVSPALLPLFIGFMLIALGLLLIGIAIMSAGMRPIGEGIRKALIHWRKGGWISERILRFYTIVIIFVCYVYLNIPRIDFFLSSLLFLIAFITIFYLDNYSIMTRLFLFYLSSSLFFLLYFILGLDKILEKFIPYGTDILTLLFILLFSAYGWILSRKQTHFRRKYRVGMIVAVAVPFILCPAFKYFLLVPLPHEGLAVAAMDAIYYNFF